MKRIGLMVLVLLFVAGVVYAAEGFGPYDYSNSKEYWNFTDGDIVPGTDSNVAIGASGKAITNLHADAITLGGTERSSWGTSLGLDASYAVGNTVDLDAKGDMELDLTVTDRKVQIANTYASGAQAIGLEIDNEAAVALTDALKFNTTAGTIVDAIDASDAGITNALNAGANTITGEAAIIDFTDFDVSADGLVVLAPDGGGDGITVTPSAALTDAIDASNADIVNAINIGGNAIAGTNFSVAADSGALTVENTIDSAFTNQQYLLSLAYTRDGDANAEFIKCSDAAGTDKFLVAEEGNVVTEGTITAAGDINANGNVVGDGATELSGMIAAHQAHTAGDTLTIAESGKINDNTGAGGQVILTLPEASTAVGVKYMFAVTAAQALNINPNDGVDKILGATDAAGDSIASSTVGDTVTLMAVDATNWVVLSAYPASTDWVDSN